MNSEISSTSSPRHGALAALHQGGWAATTMAAVFLIGGVLLTASGCDRSSTGTQQAMGASAGATVDRNPSVALSGTPTTDPSGIQYVSSVDPGQALVSGTSTLHDWTVKSNIVNGHAEFSGQWKAVSAATNTLHSIDLVIPVDSLKSTEGSGMDKTMYDALNLKQFPTITYSLIKASLKASPSNQDSAYHFDTTGQLTVAGAAHQVNLDVGVLPQGDGRLTITTDISLKMTDFGIKPPTAMMGMIKSGDAITVKVNWQLMTRPPTAKAEK
jgi:polyisoprenoid-binding protein YceI